MQTDATLGAVMRALDEQGIADNTLLIFTSDNGCSPQADFPALLAKGHNPSHVLRGHKADIWDGGHRVPFVVRWPAKVKAGTSCDQLVSLVDFMATCASITGTKLPDNAAEDSVSILPALLGTADRPLREALVHHSINGRFSIRQGSWKLELCPGSGGWSVPNDQQAAKTGPAGRATPRYDPRHQRAAQPRSRTPGGGQTSDRAAGEIRGRRPQYPRGQAVQQ